MISNCLSEFEYVKSMQENLISDAILIKKADKPYILKTLTANPDTLKELTKTIKALTHFNLINYSEIIPINTNEVAILQDYIPGISISKLLQSHAEEKRQILESEIIKWTHEILLALEYIHSKGITHGRMTPSNIIITEDQSMKLTNYATTRILMEFDNHISSIKVGAYTAPEIFEGEILPCSDIWALGCIIYEMCTFKPLIDTTSIIQLLNSQKALKTVSLEGYSKTLNELVNMMLIKEQNERPEASELLKSGLFKEKIGVMMEWEKDYEKAINFAEHIHNSEDIQQALKMFKRVKESCTENNCKRELYWKLGSLYFKIGLYGKALSALLKSLEMYENTFHIKTEEMGLLLIELATVQNVLNKSISCYDNLIKAIKILEDLQSKYLGYAYSCIADYFIDQNNINSSEYLKKAFPLAKNYGEANVYKVLGKLKLSHNESDEAIIQFMKAKELYGESLLDKAEIEGGLGEAYNIKGDKVKSMEYFSEAINTMSSPNVINANLGKIFEKLGEINAQEKDWDKFFENFERAAKIYEKTNNWGLLATCYYGIAELLDNAVDSLGKDQVLRYANLTTNLQSKIAEINKHEISMFNTTLVKAFIMIGQYNAIDSLKDSLKVFEEALKFVNEVSDTKLLLNLYELLANGYYKTKEYEKCLSFMEKTISLTKEGEDEPNLHILYGKVYGKLRLWNESLKSFETAINIFECRKIEDELKAYAVLNLAITQSNLGNIDKTIELTKFAISIYEKINPDSISLGNAYRTLAIAYKNKGNYQEQITIIINALDIYKNYEGTNCKQANCYVLLAITFGNLGNFPKKQEFAKKAVGLLEQYGKTRNKVLAYAYLTLGIAFGALGEWEKQEEYVIKAIAVYNECKTEMYNLGYSYYCLGLAVVNQGKIEDGMKEFEKAKSYYEKAKEINSEDYADVCYLIGIMYERQGQSKLAKDYIEKAYNIRRELYGDDDTKVKEILSILSKKSK